MNDLFLLLCVFFVSSFFTLIVRRYAIKMHLFDIPNHRSSHIVPTPRGGGLAIAITFFVLTIYLWAIGRIVDDNGIAIVGAALAVCVVSYWDDHGHVSAKVRFLVHLSAAGWLVVWLGGVFSVPIYYFGVIELGYIGVVIAVLGGVWLLNLYNFMDGIDGIAGVQAVTSGSAGAFLLWLSGSYDLAFWLLGVVAASAGFLVWNFPPAKIFMGDVESSFLGVLFASFILMSANQVGSVSVWVWLILLGVFIVDATYTLLRRVLTGKRWYEAHRSHTYQIASRYYCSHKRVSLAVLFINLLWLLPLAWYAFESPEMGGFLVLLAYSPLLFLCVKYQAGIDEK